MSSLRVTKISINRGRLETPRGAIETLIRGESFGLGLGITRVSGLTDMAFLAMNTPIWETKRYEPRPRLCDGDGPIPAYRKWATQFHSAPPT